MRKSLKSLLSVLTIALTINVANAFPDVSDNHWAAPQIKLLSEQGVIVGYPDGTFQPDENVTRAEFASMAIKALGQQNTKVIQPVNFTDIDPDHWAYDVIQKALYFELVSVEKDGELFRPDDSVSRAESLSVAVNALTTEQISVLKAKEVLKTIEKHYAIDSRFRTINTNLINYEDTFFLENIIYNELILRGYSVYTGKTYKGEIDFVVIDGKKKCF